MTNLETAARQALEALENGKRVRECEGGTKYQPTLEDAAIAAIRSALNTPDQLAEQHAKLAQHCAMLENKLAAMEARMEQPDYWQEEARRYAGNADYWRERCKAQEKT